ncbi:MAG: hypothetical protein OEV86_15780 [Candidatus Krumholzibacteria bacterium]|nr:hypothetical protein [Candidatus Krumholzibacteria bacterium]
MASLTKYVFNEPAFRQMVNQPGGGVEALLHRQAVRVEIAAQAALSVPWPGSRSRNPAPGPPRLRTGDLRNSIRVDGPMLGSDGFIEIPVASTSVHRGFDYSDWLRDNGYEFVQISDLA